MSRASSALDSGVRVEVEIILEWMCDILLDKNPRTWVQILISCWTTFFGKEANVMAFGGDNHNKSNLVSSVLYEDLYWSVTNLLVVDIFVRFIKCTPDALDMLHLLLNDMLVLAFGDTITEVEELQRHTSHADFRHPLAEEWG